MPKMNTVKENNISIKLNYLYNLIYQILGMLIPLITTPYVSRILGASQIGEYTYALSIVTYFNLISNMGLGTYAQLEIAKNRNDKKYIKSFFSEILLCKLLLSVLALLFYTFYVLNIRNVLCFILYLPILTSLIDISWLFQGLEQFKIIVIRNIIIKFACLVLIFCFVKKQSDLVIYALILQGSALLGNATFWFHQKHFDFKYIKCNKIFKHLRNGITYFIPTIALTIYSMMDASMLGWIGKESAEIGYYEQAHKIERVVVAILTSLSTVMLPRMAFLHQTASSEEVIKKIKQSLCFISLIGWPLSVGTFAISDILVPIFLGANYEKSVVLLRIFSILIIIVGLNNIIGTQCLMSGGKQKKYNYSVIIGALLNLLLNVILIPVFSSIGAAIASVFGEFVILLMFLYFSHKLIKIKSFIFINLPFIILSVIMGIIIYWMKKYLTCSIQSLIIIFIVAFLFYSSVIFGVFITMKKIRRKAKK